MQNRLSRTLQAVLVAAALGASAISASPAQAHSFSFGFQFGHGDFMFGRPHLHFPRLCLTDRQLRRAIRARGYHDIFLNVENNNRIQVRATRGRWVYLLWVNACTGRILDRERLRPA